MERDTAPDKTFADDTLGYPGSEDGESPEQNAQPLRAPDPDPGGPQEYTPSPADAYKPGGGNPVPGSETEPDAPERRPR